ncbi:hypothetical protein RJ639_019735 [Escallonia herrerae]|uniref:Pectin acetylesterase n=1 Tax=Escallonia herrerae TaxID=1293975 RepID=A0AA89AII4_9ASTE|nr:hypothetical protein RJ639_019735 [Escallonia herrerae]
MIRMSRMISPTLGQCLCKLFCLVLLVKAEDSSVNITIVENAVATGAVCLDGTPPAYHFDKGAGDGANSWLVHLEALLTGCSAGGLASILHCDNFRDLMPATARVKCASDAGFIHAYSIFLLIQHILTPRPADDPGLSFQTCSFNYEKRSPRQAIPWKDFRLEFIITLARLGTCSSRGLFINSCFAHCQSTDGKKWFGDFAEKLGNKAMAKALGDWYHDRSGFRQIDFKHDLPQSCN